MDQPEVSFREGDSLAGARDGSQCLLVGCHQEWETAGAQYFGLAQG